jgi:hypothetical protein
MDRKVVSYLFPKCEWTKVLISLLALLVLVAGGLSCLSAQSRKKSQPKIRIVIDASRDGGAWWFPQGPPPFDPQKPHQGVLLANYLKGRGWKVIEIPRETKITGQFKGATMVVRFNKWGGYDASEVMAYREFVRNGGRLLILQGYVRDAEAENDGVARQFGIHFQGMVEADEMRRAKGVSPDYNSTVYRIGSIVDQYPQATRPLARIDDGRLVMGTFRFGWGRIIFLSSVFPVLQAPELFINQLFDDLSRSRPKRKRR